MKNEGQQLANTEERGGGGEKQKYNKEKTRDTQRHVIDVLFFSLAGFVVGRTNERKTKTKRTKYSVLTFLVRHRHGNTPTHTHEEEDERKKQTNHRFCFVFVSTKALECSGCVGFRCSQIEIFVSYRLGAEREK